MKHSGKYVREDDWVGKRHQFNSSSAYNFLLSQDIHKEDLLRKIIGKLEREINVKDRAIEALEKATPAGYFKLLREHEKLQKDYQNLGKKCLDILKFHNFSSDFDELGNLSQAFAEAKTEIISLTGEKEAVTEEKSELIANRNNLENEVNDLIGTEWELLDFRTKFLALETFYNQAGLPKLWAFTKENFTDLFQIYAKEELFLAREKLAGRQPLNDWESDESLNNWINTLTEISQEEDEHSDYQSAEED